MTQWIITSSVLIVIIAVLRFVLRGKISLKLQYALWGLVLVRLLLPFSVFESPASVLNLLQKREETVAPPAIYEPYEPETVTPVTPAVPDEDIFILDDNIENIEPETNITVDEEGFVTEPEIRVISAKDILIPIWIGGIAVFGAVFAVSNLRFSKKLKNTREHLSETKAWLPVYKSSAVKTPCLFGAIKPAIYVTEEVLKDEKTICHVLEHETTHYRHGDHIWSVLRCFCLALHWYNPLVWLAAFLSMRDSELACDEDTIKRIGEDERIGYGRTLINLTCEKPAVGILSTATTMTGSKSSIKERILLIAKKPKMLWITAVLVVLIAVFAVGCTFTSAVNYNPKTTDETATETFSNEIKFDFPEITGKVRMVVTKASPKEITTEIFNETSEDIYYRISYSLYFEQDGKWYILQEIGEDEREIDFGTKIIESGKSGVWENDIKEVYGKLPDGKYCINRIINYGEMDFSENEFYVIGTEFILEDGKFVGSNENNDQNGQETTSVKKRYYRIYSEEELSAMTEEEYRTAARILGYSNEQLDYIEPFFEEGLTRAHVLMPLETSKEVSEKEQGARSERIFGTFYYDPELFGDYEGSLGFAYTIYRDRFKIIPEILSDSTVYGIIGSQYTFADSEGVRFYSVEHISGPYKTWKMPKIEGEQEHGYRQLGALISENSGNVVIFYADIPEDFDKIYEGEEPDLSSTYQISMVNSSGYEIRFDTGINLMVEFEGLPDCVKPDYIRDDGETVLFTLGGKSYLYDYWNETITELSSGNTNLNSDDAALEEWVRNLKVTQNYRTDKPFPAAVGAVFNAIVNSEDIEYIDFKDVEVYGDEREFFAAYTYIEKGGEEQVLQVRMRKTAEGYGLLARGGGPLGYGLEKTDITMANINLFDIPHMSPVAGGLSVTLGTNGKYGLYKPDGTLAADFVYDSYDYCGSIIVLGKENTKTRKYITEEHARVTGIGEKASNEYYFYHYKTGELITDKYGEEYYYTETDIEPLTSWHDAFRFCENGNLYEYQYFTDDSRDEVTMTEFHRAGTIGKTLNGLEITRYHYGPYKESIRYGISTKKDTEIIPPIYTSIEAPFEDRFVARHDDMMVTHTTRIYDLKGRVVCDKYDVINFSLFNGGSYVGVAECVGAESQAGTVCFDENGKEMPQGLWFIDKDGNAISERFDYSGWSTKVLHEYDKITVRDFVTNKDKQVSVMPYCIKNYETNLSKLKKAKKGDTVNFGYYHGETEWIVLDKEGDKLLLISKLSLDNKKFNDEYDENITWKTSDLRKWLNDEFMYEAFSQTERNLLIETTTTRNGAKDKVSLLSYSEAEKYFSTKVSRKTMPSEYAIHKVDFVPTESGGNTWFWLREGKAELTSGRVNADGTLFDRCGMDNSGFIRPIVWIDISKIK